MIEGLDYNTSSIIINAFINNKDFTDKMMREYLAANNASKMSDYRAFVSAYNAFKNNINPLPQEAINLIKNNANEYVKIINEISNNKNNNQDYSTYTFDASSYNISNFNTSTNTSFSDEASNNGYSASVNNGNNQSAANTNTKNATNNTSQVNQDVDYYDYNNGHVYSSTHAKDEMKSQIQDLDKNIIKFNEELHSSKEKKSKKDFYRLQEMKAKKENLEEQYNSINDLSKNYDDKFKTNFRDKRINYYQKKIEKRKNEIAGAKYESNKEKMKEKLEKWKMKQGKIKEKQRKSVDKKIIKGYNKALKTNKISNRIKALDEYKKYRDELINAKRNQSSINLINKITNKVYDIRSIPLDLQIKRLQQKEGRINKNYIINKANKLKQAFNNQYQGKHFAA